MGRTSAEVKNRWRKTAKKQFNTDLDIELAEKINEALKEKGWSKAEFIRQAARELLGIADDVRGS